MPTSDLLLRMRATGGSQVAGESGLARGAVGKLAGAAGFLGLALGVDESVKKFAEFQKQMVMLRTQAGASQAEVNRMTKALSGFKLPAQLATSPEVLARGLYHLESQGLRGAKALDALKTAAMGAKVGNANLEDVTNALGAAVVSGIKGVRNMNQAMGVLNATVGAGDMRMQDLADAMGTGILASARVFGLSLKDVSAALAVYGDNNIRGAEAGTRLRMAISLMAAPSKQAAKALAVIGLGATQLGEDMRKPNGLLVALLDLQSHLKRSGKDATEQAHILSEAFGGGRTSSGILILLSQLDRLRTKYADVTKGGKQFNAGWKATTRTLSFALDRIKVVGEVALVQMGGALWHVAQVAGKALNPAFKTLGPILANVGAWLSRNRKSFEDVAHIIGVVMGKGIKIMVWWFQNLLVPILETAVKVVSTLAQAFWWVGQRIAWVVRQVMGPLKSAVGFLNSASSTIGDLLGLGGGVSTAREVLPTLTPGAQTFLPGHPVFMPGANTGNIVAPPIIGGRPVAQGGSGPPTVAGPHRAPKTANVLAPVTVHAHFHVGPREIARATAQGDLQMKAVR